MIERNKAELILSAIAKEFSLHGTFDEGFIRVPLSTPIDAWKLKRMTKTFNVKSYIHVSNTMTETFVLVVF